MQIKSKKNLVDTACNPMHSGQVQRHSHIVEYHKPSNILLTRFVGNYSNTTSSAAQVMQFHDNTLGQMS